MAAGKYQESSSSRFSNCKHQVFLSFRGSDTRKNFTDHLYTALVQAGIHTFRDDDEIRRGQNIELEIQKAIQQSKISIIVFSKDYAWSRWCLDELVMIMERKRTANSMVLPIFYDVDPSQVSNETGTFADAFVEHEKCFKGEMERVNGWRIALKEVADLGGMVLGDGYEAQFVQSIVEKVSKNLDRKVFHVPLHFVGRDPLIQYMINSWLQDRSHGAATALLYGIGGVGKTAIAKSVYNQNFYKFEGNSFLSNFRERSKEFKGVVCLQRQLLSDILKKTVDEINDVDEGILKIKDALCCRRTLIVLDDVDEREQFNAIVGMQNWLCEGSKIIVTTRNKSLVSANDIEWLKCKVEPLDNVKALELFSWHAFGHAYPVEGFVENSWRIVHHCNGLPLALRVIGSSLSGKSKEVWESALQEMELIPNCEVLKVLRISYDSLDDDYQKNLFLDMACFFNGMNYNYAVKILDGLDRCRCLVEIVEITNDKRLWMHQLVRDMGREIARQESPKCQRIWHHMEALTVLKETSDNFFQHYRLPAFPSREWLSDLFFGEQLQTSQASLLPVLSTDALRNMRNVKFLQLNYMKFYGSYEHFPKNLIWLCWHGFYLRSLPKHLCLEKVVVLDLSRSCLVDAWKGKLLNLSVFAVLPKLKILDLRHSHGLIRTPDLSGIPRLENLILEDCIHLVQIHESIGDLRSLVMLNLKNCKSLVELPEELSGLNSLKELYLNGCSNLESLNFQLENHQGHRFLESDACAASTPSIIRSLSLKLLFPSRFSARKAPRFTLPHSLTRLDLSGTPIRFLPESIKDLSPLVALTLRNCKCLDTPELPSNLSSLDVSSSYSLQRVPNLIPWTVVYDCDQLADIQDWVKLELIQKADSHMFRILESVNAHIQPWIFQVSVLKGVFNVAVSDEDGMVKFYEEEEEEWIIQKEFRTRETRLRGSVNIEIRNNTSGRSLFCPASFFPSGYRHGNGVIQSLSHWKLGVEDPTFDNGDDVSISVLSLDPTIQVMMVGILWLHEEEGKGNGDGDKIQSNNKVVTSHCSSSSNREVSATHNSIDADDDVHLAKAEIASRIFRNFSCSARYNPGNLEVSSWLFEEGAGHSPPPEKNCMAGGVDQPLPFLSLAGSGLHGDLHQRKHNTQKRKQWQFGFSSLLQISDLLFPFLRWLIGAEELATDREERSQAVGALEADGAAT
uniref:TIR domain-containing protein n=1 Tax=Salix viminalis TaxID=40686 RepID=A0A6N2LHN0_SALVM